NSPCEFEGGGNHNKSESRVQSARRPSRHRATLLIWAAPANFYSAQGPSHWEAPCGRHMRRLRVAPQAGEKINNDGNVDRQCDDLDDVMVRAEKLINLKGDEQ